MSTTWGYYCATCGKSSEDQWYRDELLLIELAQHYSLLKKLYDNPRLQGYLQISMIGNSEPVEFLLEHYQHGEVLLENCYEERLPIPHPIPAQGEEQISL